MKRRVLAAGAFVLFLAAVGAVGADFVILKGGTRLELKQPPMRQGNNILLTRTDGTLFSVPDSEVDWKATAAAKKAPAAKTAPSGVAPAETAAEAARAAREGPKARVKITDADVNHEALGTGEEEEKKEPDKATSSAGAMVEVGDYTQEKSGNNLIVRGNLRNVGSTPATNVSMSVTAIDDAGKGMGSGGATLSKGVIESGTSVSFSAALPVGDKTPRSLQFTPRWSTPAPPPSAPSAEKGNGGMNSGASAAPETPAARPAPRPVPTPYGQGLLYAAPAAAASTAPPADGKNGYIPGPARPEDQPKPPQ